jgi:outer membrane lipoprotein SlyB
MQNVDMGTVTNVREVNIEGSKTNLGMYGGGLIGSAAASGGSGVGGAIVQATGAVAGAIVGQGVEEAATRRRAQEITVRMDDGRTVVVTQRVDGGLYRDGDRVRILNSGNHAQVAMDVGR